MQINMKKMFLDFLREHDAVTAYFTNFYSKNNTGRRDLFVSFGFGCSIGGFLISAPPEKYIQGAFFWGDTTEGYAYWLILHERWLTKLPLK